jgi:hypothetical protein
VLDVRDAVGGHDRDQTVAPKVRLLDGGVEMSQGLLGNPSVAEVASEGPPPLLDALRSVLDVGSGGQVDREERAIAPDDLGEIRGYDGTFG